MKPIIAVAMVLSTSIASAAWIQVGKGTGPAKVSIGAASASGATVTVEIPGVQTESVAIDGVQYLKLTIPGAVSAVLDVGKPEVPAVPVLLARPTGSTVMLRILSIETETLDVARVYPMQRLQKYGEQAEPLTVDNSFYASDVEYPSDRLSSPRTATWRDLDVVNVHVYPVTVRPAQHQVIVTSRIKFRADFSGGHYPARVTNWMVPMYRRLVQNYDKLRLTTTAQEPPGTKCLVFCDTAYTATPALDSLLSLMTVLGDSAETIHVSSSWQPEDIKSAIIDRYDTTQVIHALHWVFLVGRYDQIQPKPNYRGSPYSDYWYSDLSGDSQGPLGCDNYPEVGIARLAPDDGADLSRQIAKTRDYMLGKDSADWPNRMTLVAHQCDDADTTVRAVVQVAETMHFYHFTIDPIFGKPAPGESLQNNDSVSNSINAGTGVLIYLGHGGLDRWDDWYSYPDSFLHLWTKAEVDGLHNSHPPVVFNLACECGKVDPETTCLSQKWMSKCDSSGKGAVASFACYSTADILAANVQCTVAVRAIADYDTVHGTPRDYVAPVFDLGGIQMLMDAYIATNLPDTLLDNIYSFYWLGNPAMPVWSGGVPVSADVSHPSWITPGDHSFLVTVTVDGQYVEGAQVCAYKPDDFYAVGLTDEDGTVTLSLTATDTGSFFVSVSKGHVNLSNRGWRPHTPMLPYFDTAFVCKPDSAMTYPNWGRKLVRDPSDASKLNVVYTARDSVFYTQSTDGGDNWSTAEPIGAGSYPAVDLPDAASGKAWVVYLASDGSIVRAIRSAATFAPVTWDTDTIFQSTDSSRAGAPSLAADASLIILANAGVTYPVYVGSSPTQSYIYYRFLTPFTMSPPEVVDGPRAESCYGASIAVTPGSFVHVAWARGESIYYRQRDTAWSLPVQISSDSLQPATAPASNPSVEAYGEYVYCVWCGPDTLGNFPGDVWRRSHYVWLDPTNWPNAATNQSESPDTESDFPVMTTDFVTVWQEQVSPDSTEIWGRFLLAGPLQLFQEPLPCRYPQVDGYWVPRTLHFRCRTVWTQQASWNPPQDTLGYGWYDYIPSLGKGLGPGPHEDYEPASYYAAELGQPKQSPYCLSRGGFAQFEFWNTDTSTTGLTYRLPFLDPRRTYRIRAVLYHEGDKVWDAELRCDSGPWHRVRVEPRMPDTFWLQVPKALYKNDAQIVVELARVTGGYVSLAKLKLFQIEEQPGEDGGVQSLGSGWTYVTRLRNCSPNPFARAASINYELAQYGPVHLTVHDAAGRLVRRLECGPRQRGFHAVRWDGADGRGHAVSAGVYFVRLSACGKTSTGRLTLVR